MFIAIFISLITGVGLGFGFRGLIERQKNAAAAALKSSAEAEIKKL